MELKLYNCRTGKIIESRQLTLLDYATPWLWLAIAEACFNGSHTSAWADYTNMCISKAA